MSDPLHTPGPWRVDQYHGGGLDIESETPFRGSWPFQVGATRVARVFDTQPGGCGWDSDDDGNEIMPPEMRANAQLVAAATDLRAALESLLTDIFTQCCCEGEGDCVYCVAIKALIKAGRLFCQECEAVSNLTEVIEQDFYCSGCSRHICVRCGCTDNAACADGCSWIASGICSTHQAELTAAGSAQALLEGLL